MQRLRHINVAPIAQLVSNKQGARHLRQRFHRDVEQHGRRTLASLTVENVGTVPMQNMVMIDILPFVGDTGVRDTSPRGSTWTPLLAAPILPPAGTILYYSTSGNPCRPEVGGPTSSCDPPNWTTVAPVPITSVRSFKVDFGSRVIGAFDSLSFTFNLTTPGHLPAGSAYNSTPTRPTVPTGWARSPPSRRRSASRPAPAPPGCWATSCGWTPIRTACRTTAPPASTGVNVRLYSPGAPTAAAGALRGRPYCWRPR